MSSHSEATYISSLYALARQQSPKFSSPALMSGFPCPGEARVTQANWMFPPFNTWGFRNVARLRPTIEVACKSGAVSPLGQSHQALDSLVFESTCGERVTVAEHLRTSHTDGLIVLQGDDVLLEHYDNGQVASDRHIMFSVTKSIIGLLAEDLVSKNSINPELDVRHYVPELEESAFGRASVQQLLDMAVGVKFNETYDDVNSESSQYGRACGIYAPIPEAQNQESLYQFLPSLTQERPHGGFFHYVTATTEVLAWVMERASGRSCTDLLEDIWSHLGCERDGHFLADPWGRNVAGAGFSATLRDMARLGRVIAQGGVHSDKRLISPDAIDRVLKGTDPTYLGSNPGFSPWTPGASYKSQWYVFNDEAMMAGGVHGQYLYIHPQSQVVIVKQSSLPEAVSALDPDSVRMFQAIVRQLS